MIAALAGLLMTVASTYYSVTLTRVEQNLYRVGYSSTYIVTRYCYEYVYSDDAIVSYDYGSYGNFIVFSSGQKCDIAKVVGP